MNDTPYMEHKAADAAVHARDEAKRIQQLEARVFTLTSELETAQERIAVLQSLAHVAWSLCHFTRHHKYPAEMSDEFLELTSLLDQLDTEVRRIFPKK